MIMKHMKGLMSAITVIALASGCASSGETVKQEKPSVISFKDYEDHNFNPRGYIKGMEKVGHNILVWQDPSVDLKKYDSANLSEFGGRLLPVQDRFSYEPFIKNFNLSFARSLRLKAGDGQTSLSIEGEVVECNPGSRAARVWVGYGAGRTGGAVVCEVYEPGETRPCIRIYARDTGSSGMWGGDSVAMLNSIFDRVATRVTSALEARIGQ